MSGRKKQAIVDVRSGRTSTSKAIKIDDGTLIRLRLLALHAQIAEGDATIDESEIVKRLVAREAIP